MNVSKNCYDDEIIVVTSGHNQPVNGETGVIDMSR